MNTISTSTAVIGTIIYIGAKALINHTKTKNFVEAAHRDKKDEDGTNNECHYVMLYKCHFLCPKLTGTLYKFNGKYISASEFAKFQLTQNTEFTSYNTKLTETMDGELKKLMKGDHIQGCSEIGKFSIWTLPNLMPGGYQYYRFVYTPEKGLLGNGVGRVWW